LALNEFLVSTTGLEGLSKGMKYAKTAHLQDSNMESPKYPYVCECI